MKGFCPGSAERILTMAERQSAHRIQLEADVVHSNISKEKTGMVLAFAISMTSIIGGVVVIVTGKSTEGITAIIGTLVGLVGVFIYGRHAQAKERKEKNM